MSSINTNIEFTSDWFSANIPRWKKHLEQFADKPCSYLEIGVHEGRSVSWMLENILLNAQSKAYCIDIWWSSAYYRRFLNNIIISLNDTQLKKLNFVKDSSLNELPRLIQSRQQFDVIYIDGKHHSDTVLMEFGMCWNLLKVGGIIIFDDYMYKEENGTPVSMKNGIDNIINNFTGKLEIIDKNYQLFIKKIN